MTGRLANLWIDVDKFSSGPRRADEQAKSTPGVAAQPTKVEQPVRALEPSLSPSSGWQPGSIEPAGWRILFLPKNLSHLKQMFRSLPQVHATSIKVAGLNRSITLLEEIDMRKALLALAAVSLAIPASMAVPTDGAQARKNYRYKEWRGRDGRTYCRKSNGTTGLIVGGVGGALVGRAIDTRGDRATGTILGAAGGALLGKEIDSKRRCR
jgi:hypothetical protein